MTNITKRTVYTYKGKDFDTEEEASEYSKRRLLTDHIEKHVPLRYEDDWEEVLSKLNSYGYTIVKTN